MQCQSWSGILFRRRLYNIAAASALAHMRTEMSSTSFMWQGGTYKTTSCCAPCTLRDKVGCRANTLVPLRTHVERVTKGYVSKQSPTCISRAHHLCSWRMGAGIKQNRFYFPAACPYLWEPGKAPRTPFRRLLGGVRR